MRYKFAFLPQRRYALCMIVQPSKRFALPLASIGSATPVFMKTPNELIKHVELVVKTRQCIDKMCDLAIEAFPQDSVVSFYIAPWASYAIVQQPDGTLEVVEPRCENKLEYDRHP